MVEIQVNEDIIGLMTKPIIFLSVVGRSSIKQNEHIW